MINDKLSSDILKSFAEGLGMDGLMILGLGHSNKMVFMSTGLTGLSQLAILQLANAHVSGELLAQSAEIVGNNSAEPVDANSGSVGNDSVEEPSVSGTAPVEVTEAKA